MTPRMNQTRREGVEGSTQPHPPPVPASAGWHGFRALGMRTE